MKFKIGTPVTYKLNHKVHGIVVSKELHNLAEPSVIVMLDENTPKEYGVKMADMENPYYKRDYMDEKYFSIKARYINAFISNLKETEDTQQYDKYSDKHYAEMGDIQPIEVMQECMTAAEFKGFLRGNIIKYVMRIGHKDDADKEISKIVRYAEWLEKAEQGKKINPRE